MSGLRECGTTVTVLLCISLMSTGSAGAEALGPPESGEDGRSLNPLAQIDPVSLEGFRDRPLFASTRTRREDPPYLEKNPPGSPDMSDGLDIRILGIVIAPDKKAAFVLEVASNQQHVLHVGDELSGWSVASIEPDSGLTMTKGDMRQVFVVFGK